MKLVAYALLVITMFAVRAAADDAVVVGSNDTKHVLGLLLTIALTFVSTLIHEIGHALAVRLVGGRVRRLVAYPLGVDFNPLRWRLVWKQKGSEVGGFVTFQLDRIEARKKHVVIAFAGPLASLILGLGSGAAASLVVERSIRAILTSLAVLSVGVGIANLLPFDNSDGAHIVRGLFAKRGRGAQG